MMIHIDERPKCFKNWLHETVIVILMMLAQLLSQIAMFQSHPVMNILEKAFKNVNGYEKVWLLASSPLTTGAFILISGKFGDLYGLKIVLMCGITWCCIWTLLSGISRYSESLIFFCICRAFQGIGLAFILPTAIGIAGNLYPNGQRKAIVFCLIASCAPLGAALGSVFGALTGQFGHWEWGFYSNAIVLFLMGIGVQLVVPTITPHPAQLGMDWPGAVTGVVGLLLFNFAWNQAPAAGWDSPYIIVLLIIGILALALFFYVEKKVKSPLLPSEIMDINILLTLTVTFLGWGSFSIWSYYHYCLLLNLRHYNPLESGATFCNFAVFGSLACFIVSMLIKKVKPSYILLASMCAFFVGIAMLSKTPIHQTFFNMSFAQMVILSFGMDLSFPAALLILSDALPKKHQGMAGSLVSTMVNYSMSIGLGIAATAEVQIYEKTSDLLKSYRAAMYVGIGFAVAAILLNIVQVMVSYNWNDEKIEKREHACL
ncbi:Drug resistance protein [Wickerhamomyces ciferrii]|uniref:Drug resistance protein n=1 Tax=Wickerhamomyces ciferrii (strain ATCC 14091 / BCRC 22168 / CBS 111 / JCM 3599 / NBRC 0793 / NRRL Y-1031 F-60-10) TaxID=1206466 RepID=K0KWC1_WICCF|nr:Drug resistance protein [Wickerhamomyces ciferrii]CCH45779.1 Drug resistance protein [Wickerhamomyces ciferrii]